jgi:hypothetical protein
MTTDLPSRDVQAALTGKLATHQFGYLPFDVTAPVKLPKRKNTYKYSKCDERTLRLRPKRP